MYVCALRFEDPDPDNPGYSLLEVQFYAWTARRSQRMEGIPEHGLYLRKNMKTGKFELVREYDGPVRFLYEDQPRMLLHVEPGTVNEVIFAGELHDALQMGDQEYARFFGRRDLVDGMCIHRRPYRDDLCPVNSKADAARLLP
jgi:hypothetical protein